MDEDELDLAMPDHERESLMNAMDFSGIQKVLGDQMPQLAPGEVGRLRLMRSLRGNFGEAFRSNKIAQGAITEFDEQTKQAKEILRLRRIQNG